ncbi:hypothetical protein MGG_15032 [Pyricularia oryzae 70-15]|uniref:Uncharacterized protein n=1 Tax=Pyricularia oryzae (strain 70-15 / ATCC MYA-4617 / FGSC 8958) TaxID=242507 RepID=G5EGY7_PYRO7|nr:uncharacterized protein MGG_15032 [Pyricularia oryzae 70-15]EAQ70884.1 hypothetical protein MGCH7_ch7g291 [Pyricularia oryzae 70-15]EHA46480.1 hypothetical protein MGG_15032 [Pyricularia oryzae 70-15]
MVVGKIGRQCRALEACFLEAFGEVHQSRDGPGGNAYPAGREIFTFSYGSRPLVQSRGEDFRLLFEVRASVELLLRSRQVTPRNLQRQLRESKKRQEKAEKERQEERQRAEKAEKERQEERQRAEAAEKERQEERQRVEALEQQTQPTKLDEYIAACHFLVESVRNAFDLGNGIIFENYLYIISNLLKEVVYRDTPSTPPVIPNHNFNLNRLRPD